MSVVKLHRFFLATLMAFAVTIMLPACSSTEEAPAAESGDTGEVQVGDKGIPCDLDAMQAGCEDYQPDF